MIRLDETVQAWDTLEFESVLKRELAQQAAQLPLQQGLSGSSSVADAPVTVLLHSAAEQGGTLRLKVGIFYQGRLGGCSCADDPTPDNEINEYCELQLEIDPTTALATVSLLGN